MKKQVKDLTVKEFEDVFERNKTILEELFEEDYNAPIDLYNTICKVKEFLESEVEVND